MRQLFVFSHFRRRRHAHQSFHIKNYILLWMICSRCSLRNQAKETWILYKKNRFFRVLNFVNFVKFASNRFVGEILKIQLFSRKNNSEETWMQYEKKCVFRFFRCLIKFKLLIISNLLINQILHRSNRSNSIFSSIVSIRHLESVFQLIKMQKRQLKHLNLTTSATNSTRHYESAFHSIKSQKFRNINILWSIKLNYSNRLNLLLLSTHSFRHFDFRCQSIMTH